jgi:XTP/dITP diphosphohydrolase
VTQTAPAFTLLVATTNRGKLAELSLLLADLPIELVSLQQVLPGRAPVVEDGVTFEDNARIKARSAALEATMVTLAEDSGLEVDALGGRPGVRSARFAKEGATDAENNAELLLQLQETPETQRTARFRCAMIIVDPWAKSDATRELVAEGRCEGMITAQARGAGGFGYDPLFVVEETGHTMAELDDDEKNRVSHRGRAVAAIRPALEALVKRRIEECA